MTSDDEHSPHARRSAERVTRLYLTLLGPELLGDVKRSR
jgi:hypothetical protein